MAESTFVLPKKFDDIQEAQNLKEGYYRFRLTKDVYEKENNKKTGMNKVFELITVSDNPIENGRVMWYYLQLPNAADKTVFFQGRSKEDEKMERIKIFLEVFGQDAWLDEEGHFGFNKGGEAMFYVVEQPSLNNPEKKVNAISLNHFPKAV